MSAEESGPTAVDVGASRDSGNNSTTLARGVGVLIAGRFAGRAAGYGSQLVLARLLGPSDYGQFSIGLRIMLIAGLLAALGLDNGVIRFGATYLAEKKDSLRTLIRRVLGLSLIAGMVAGGVLLATSTWLAETVYQSPDLQPVLAVFALGLVFVPVLRVGAAATRVWRDMRYSVLAEDIVQPVTQLVLILVFYWLGLRVVGAAAAATLSLAVAAVLVVHYLTRLSPGLFTAAAAPIVPTRELIAFAFPTSLAGTLSLAAMWIDVLLVGYFRSEADTGIYQAAAQVTFVFVVVLASFNAVFAPMIADLYHRGAHRRLSELYRTSTRWGLLLSLPLFVVIVVDPAGLLTLVMGSRYAGGAMPMLILAVGQMINLSTGAVGLLLVMSGRQNWWLAASAGALAVNISLNIALIPRYGLVGAAVATTLSLAGLFGCGLILARTSMRLWPYDRSSLRLVAAALVAAVAVAAPGWLGVAAGNWRTVVELGLAGVVFWLVAGLAHSETSLLTLFATLRGRDGSR